MGLGIRTLVEERGDARQLGVIGGPWDVEVVIHVLWDGGGGSRALMFL